MEQIYRASDGIQTHDTALKPSGQIPLKVPNVEFDFDVCVQMFFMAIYG